MNIPNKLNKIEAYTKAYNSLKSLYETSDGKKFIHHLIYSYISGTVTYILYSKSDLFDCITGSKLDTVFESKSDLPTELRSLMTKLYKAKDSDKLKISTNINNDVIELLKNSPKSRVALRSTLSNKILGIEELNALHDFIDEQVEAKNKTIIGMVRYSKGEFKEKPKNKLKTKINNNTIGSDDTLRSKLESILI